MWVTDYGDVSDAYRGYYFIKIYYFIDIGYVFFFSLNQDNPARERLLSPFYR